MIKSLDTLRGTVIIREGTLADVVQYRELRLFALEESPTAFSADLQTNRNLPMSHWENRLRPDPHGTMFFAEHDAKLIGLTGVRQGESAKTRHAALIISVFVRPEWRGLHIAERLVESGCRWAKERGAEMVKLAVMTTNTSAVRCYERYGFTVYGTEPRAILYEGVYFDEYMMWRSLDDL